MLDFVHNSRSLWKNVFAAVVENQFKMETKWLTYWLILYLALIDLKLMFGYASELILEVLGKFWLNLWR